jgi:hypothetical protein
MARSRNIKPGFFKNEDLAECSAWARLCFIGLWTLADREGRLEDRAKRIKAELFAYDSVDVEPLLVELAARDFILRFKDGAGLGIIQVIEFTKHQSPHFKEAKSVLASPQSLGLLALKYESEASDKSAASPGLCADESSKDDTPAAPDSLIPDCLIPESGLLIAESASKSPRASRKCPETFLVTPDLQRWAREECPGVDIRAETSKLRDYTFKNTITDWSGTWRNWMRKSGDFAPIRRPGSTPPMDTATRNAATALLLGIDNESEILDAKH